MVVDGGLKTQRSTYELAAFLAVDDVRAEAGAGR